MKPLHAAFGWILPFFFLGLLFGCASPFSGQLRVTESLPLIDASQERVRLAPGRYPASVEWKKKDSMFEFRIQDDRGQPRVYFLKVPEGKGIPEEAGTFRLAAAETDPKISLQGEVIILESKTDPVRDREPCTTQERIKVCDGSPPQECYWGWRTYQGFREVTYFYDRKTKRLRLFFLPPGSDQAVAEFAGEWVEQFKRYEFRGECFGAPF